LNRLNLGRRLFAAMSLSACLLATFGLQGCATVGGAGSAEAARQATQEKLDENLAAADKALKQGQTDQALSHLDAASRVHPSAKPPWPKKAQNHIEARPYGGADPPASHHARDPGPTRPGRHGDSNI